MIVLRSAAIFAALLVVTVATHACASELKSDQSTSTTDAVPWTLQDASEAQLASGLRTCLSALDGSNTLEDSEWSVPRQVPDGVENPNAAVIFSNPASPVLLISQTDPEGKPMCSVIAAADSQTVAAAVAQLGPAFEEGITPTPHGRVWRTPNYRISEDYFNGYEFHPAVFDQSAFFSSNYNDIRIYTCDGVC